MRRTKNSAKDLYRVLMAEGTVIECKPYFNSCYVIVKAFGQLYRIDNPTDQNPTITQLCQNVEKDG